MFAHAKRHRWIMINPFDELVPPSTPPPKLGFAKHEEGSLFYYFAGSPTLGDFFPDRGMSHLDVTPAAVRILAESSVPETSSLVTVQLTICAGVCLYSVQRCPAQGT